MKNGAENWHKYKREQRTNRKRMVSVCVCVSNIFSEFPMLKWCELYKFRAKQKPMRGNYFAPNFVAAWLRIFIVSSWILSFHILLCSSENWLKRTNMFYLHLDNNNRIVHTFLQQFVRICEFPFLFSFFFCRIQMPDKLSHGRSRAKLLRNTFTLKFAEVILCGELDIVEKVMRLKCCKL